jgi:prepilin-type processing-associated H-X9-DG protein
VKEAEAEREASQLRGQGTALFREEVARGISKAAKEINAAGLDPSFVLFSMWLESMRFIAKEGKGNLLFFDGSTDGQKRQIKELMAMRMFPLENANSPGEIEDFVNGKA